MPLLEFLRRDARQSWSSLTRDKSFTITALLILALCLGANVAIFAVVDAVLVKPLPFHDADRLVAVYSRYPKAGIERAGMSVPYYLHHQADVPAYEETAAIHPYGVILGEAGAPERVDAAQVTPSFFPVLGVNAALGRTFLAAEAAEGKNQVVVLSDGLWRQHFGADPAVVGRTLRLDMRTYTVVGVMPAGFRYLAQRAQLWTPLVFSDKDRRPESNHTFNMEMVARLRPGVEIPAAQAQVDAMNAGVLKGDPYAKLVIDAGFRTDVRDLHADYVAPLRPLLLLLQVGAFFLLLIGAVNLANLLLVRATGRAKEYSVRQALGASWLQLARSLVVETVLLALAGGLLSVLLGAVALKGIMALASGPLPMAIAPALDGHVWVVVAAASVGLGLLLALPVIWQTMHGRLTLALSAESRGGTATRSVHRVRHVLIVAQIALAFVLLAGTGLLGLSFARVLAVSPGFRPEHVLTASLSLPYAHYKKAQDRLAFIETLLGQVRALPGVSSAAMGTSLPFTNAQDMTVLFIEGRSLNPGESLRSHAIGGVAGNYFETLGVPLREGRFLTLEDSRGSAKVCVIDENSARHYWPQGGAVGQRVKTDPAADGTYFTIVGVVGAVKQHDLADQKGGGAIYLPYSDRASSSFAIAVRTAQSPESIGSAIRAAVLRLDPELPLSDVKTMAMRVDNSLASRRLPLLLAGIFAGVAVVLAAVGIYGVLAYSMMQRRREIGIRLALGAAPEQILRQFLGLGGRLLGVGLPLGLIGAWLSGRAMSGLLFGVGPGNLVVLGGTTFVLATVALLACLLPSRRAARVDPSEALRNQ